MIDSKYRTIYQTLIIDPLLKKDIILSLNPHILTLAALCFGILVPVFYHIPLAAIFFLLVSGFFDTLDGSLARAKGNTSPIGAILDIASDRIVEFSIILGLYFVAPNERGLLCLWMLGSILICVTTFLVVGIFSQNETEKSFFYSPGIMERAEAFIFFGGMILFPKAFLILSLLFTALVTLTALIRIKGFISRFS